VGVARSSVVSIAVVVVASLAGAAVAVAGSQSGAMVGGVPLFALCVGLAFAVQWAAFVPAFRLGTERFYDLAGSLTYIGIVLLAVALAPAPDARAWLLAALVVAWAARLGWHLVRRIRRAGRDGRFDAIKSSAPRFLVAWTVQGLWIALTASAALAAITTTLRVPLDALAIVGSLAWLAGFVIETAADRQKAAFRADPANAGQFIRSGLWAWSRHPNYFGEIVLWAGVALVALPALRGWQYATLISPVFVWFLLTRVSGVPLLERKADATWGGQPDYEAYKAATPVLVPRPPRS